MDLAGTIWDAVVVGAGPAGGLVAALLAERGWRVALLERARWPREKVCGGCVNASAAGMLMELGLDEVLRGAGELQGLCLHAGNARLSLRLPGGAAIPRAQLDERILAAAVRRGCSFFPGCQAKLPAKDCGPFRHLMVGGDGGSTIVQARVVLACDGIAGTLLEAEPWAAWRMAPDGWIGMSATLAGVDAANELAPGGMIGMHIGQNGYAGTVRYADGRLHIAAAVSPGACRAAGGPAAMLTAILGDRARGLAPALHAARFAGTGLLTRRRTALGGHRVLVVGDACGYVEPFTGEGIAWALRGARAAAELLVETPGAPVQWLADLAERWTEDMDNSSGGGSGGAGCFGG